MCVCGCCRQVEDCLPPEGLPLPAACGNHGALPGYKPLVCTDKKTWRAKINYLQADPCTPRLAWHFSCIKCHYLWSHPFYCLFYLSAVQSLLHSPRAFSHMEFFHRGPSLFFFFFFGLYNEAFFFNQLWRCIFKTSLYKTPFGKKHLLNRPECSLMVPKLSQLFSVFASWDHQCPLGSLLPCFI